MLLARRQESINLNPLMLTLRSKSAGGQFGRLGVDWPLVLQIGGWVIISQRRIRKVAASRNGNRL
jgi:hypothetical protein